MRRGWAQICVIEDLSFDLSAWMESNGIVASFETWRSNRIEI